MTKRWEIEIRVIFAISHIIRKLNKINNAKLNLAAGNVDNFNNKWENGVRKINTNLVCLKPLRA